MSDNQVKLFYYAMINNVRGIRTLPTPKKKNLEEALTIAASNDSVDVVNHIMFRQKEHKMKPFHARRALTTAAEFGADETVNLLLEKWRFREEDIEQSMSWAME